MPYLPDTFVRTNNVTKNKTDKTPALKEPTSFSGKKQYVEKHV